VASGRPRSFDIDEALDRALKVFLRKGYMGASLEELTRTMRINPPSLYAAFGNKEGLFRQALDRYMEERTQFQQRALALPTIREVIEVLLRGSADLQTGDKFAPGCLIVQGALSTGEEADPIRLELTQRREDAEAALRARLEEGQASGDLPEDVNCAALARFVTITINGMAIHAASGATRAELQETVDLTMAALPKTRGRRQTRVVAHKTRNKPTLSKQK
jgi:AcrR family transcriptional regulator